MVEPVHNEACPPSHPRLPAQRPPVTRVNPDSNRGGVMDMEPCYYCMIYAPGTPGFPHIWLHQLGGKPWISGPRLTQS